MTNKRNSTRWRSTLGFVSVFWLVGSVELIHPLKAADKVTLNRKEDGYRGIWYFNQKSNDEYVYKYSGGLGTYCAKHNPFAIYDHVSDRTYFCYGGSTKGSNRELVHCVSYFDHKTGKVPRPTVLLNKNTDDAHDNPVISIDAKGHIWIFSTSHGRSRPSFVHRSQQPYSIAAFEQVNATYVSNEQPKVLDNFSYMQTWSTGQGFVSFFTRYDDPAKRTSMFMTSTDGLNWSPWQRLAAIEWGHYQISTVSNSKVGCAFNYHPKGKGLNWRTNLYYVESTDGGKSWNNASGEKLNIPVTAANNIAKVIDYQSQGLNVYLKDIAYDDNKPVILYITSKGYQSGPQNNPRTWRVARWTGRQWESGRITTSDNNYDMGSLYIGDNGNYQVIAPTSPGPQAYNPGGEVCLWSSGDYGQSWRRRKQLTQNSTRNHTYVRRPVNAHPDFYAFWADGHGRMPSESRLYYCNAKGEVFVLPAQMPEDFAIPQRVVAPVNNPDR